MRDALSPGERLALLRTLNELPHSIFEEIRIAIGAPAHVLPSGSAAQGDRGAALVDWSNTPVGCTSFILKETVDAVVAYHQWQSLSVPSSSRLVSKPIRILDTEWSELFAAFRTEDCGTILTGFFAGFEQVFTSSFSDVRPDEPLTDSARVQDLLVTYDRPELAVRFVECAIAQIQALAGENARDLRPLEEWRDRIAQKFEIAPRVADMNDRPLCYGYLLIAIDASHGDENLMIYPELRVTGKESAIPLNISTTPRSIDQLLIDLPQWIKEAEHQLFKENYNLEDGEVVLELFLPSSYLGRDMDNWKIKDDDDDLISLMSHRRFVLRSWDRIHDRTIQHGLKKRWHVLQSSKQKTICQLFHLQEQPPTNELIPLLKDQDDRVGLKLVSPFPSDSSERNKIFKIFKKVPIPLILWSCNPDISGKDVLEPAFNEILETSHLEHFAHLARQWRHRRNQSSIAKPIKLLCDCPDRVPTNVPKDEDTDALVAA